MTQAIHHNQRFDALDGIRGLAALEVMVYHLTHEGLHLVRSAWVAVDLFFILSGFVIMHSYGDKIRNGLSFGDFAKARLIRLAPLYFAGLLLGIAGALVVLYGEPATRLSGWDVLKASASGMLLLPYFNHTDWPFGAIAHASEVFPLNPPSWSLFFELIINACFFFYIVRFRTISVKLVLFWVAIELAVFLGTDVRNPGWGTDNLLWGFPRVAAEFGLGALIYSHHHRLTRKARILAAALTAMVFAFFLSTSEVKVMLNTFVVAPAAILTSVKVELGGLLRAVCKWLGELSYPLYIVHIPVYSLALHLFHADRLAPLTQLGVVSAAAIACAALLIPLDKRVRKALNARFMAPRTASRVTA